MNQNWTDIMLKEVSNWFKILKAINQGLIIDTKHFSIADKRGCLVDSTGKNWWIYNMRDDVSVDNIINSIKK